MRVDHWRGRSRFLQLIHLVVLLLALSARTVGEQLPIKAYTTAEGLAHDRVKRIVCDSRGFLWFCTPSGLTRFDGHRFTTYTTTHGLPVQSVNSIVETRPGVYWVATTGGGVARLDLSTGPVFVNAGHGGDARTPSGVTPDARQAGITVFKLDDEPRANNVWQLHQGRGGQVWAATVGGLFRLESADGREAFRRVELGIPSRLERLVQIEALLEDAEGSLWIGTYFGLLRRLPDGRVIHYTIKPGLLREHVAALISDREERLWIGHRSGVTVFVPEPAATIATTEHYSERVLTAPGMKSQSSEGRITLPATASEARHYKTAHYVYDLRLSSEGKVWVATFGGGLAEFNGGQFRGYTTAHGLSSNVINSLGEDRSGNLWVGTNDAGVMKLIRNGFVSVPRANPPNEFQILAIFEGPSGELYAAAGNKFIYHLERRLDGARLSVTQTNLPAGVGWDNRRQRAPLQDHTGEWWVPTAKGLFRFPRVAQFEQLAGARPKAVYRMQDGLAGDDVYRLFEDSHGDIWIATVGPGLLTRWERATGLFQRYAQPQGVRPEAPPSYFAEDRRGGLWVGFRQGGLARYAANRFTWLIGEGGSPANEVYHLHCDRAGRLWVSTQADGLLRLDEPGAERPRIIKYTTAEGLSHQNVRGVTEDQWGRIYIGTMSGVDRLDPATGRIKYFGAAEGLKNIEAEAVFRDRHGDVWFATRVGLARLTPEADQPLPPPSVWVNGLGIDGIPQAVSDLGETAISGLKLAADQNNLNIDFFSLAFGAGEKMLYQYQLEGIDRDWHPPTELRTVNYASLSPGSYRFLVRAVNGDGLASEVPASVDFTILPPIWRRWWFLLLTTILVVAAAYALHRYRLGRLLELERVRTRIATDLHDDLGANLSQIAILSEVVSRRLDPQDALTREPLASVTQTARESVDSMSDIVWAIDPQRDHLRDLTHRLRHFASEVLAARDIALSFRAPAVEEDGHLGADVRREVFLIFKEAVNNLARHSGCAKAEIEVRRDDGWLTLTLYDDGRGFDPAQQSLGHGLASMGARAKKLGGELEIKTQPGAGTLITLKAPLVQRTAWRPHMFR